MRQILCPALIGRDEEFAVLAAALDAAQSGSGGALLILGEAGIGKSRLAREASDSARNRDFAVLTGRAVETGSPVAFRPLSEALLSHLRVSGLPALPALEPFRAALGRLVPEWRQARPRGADDSLVVLAEAVLRLLRALAAGRGCLLVLEDLHWADPETVAILEYLSDNLRAEPVVCLGTVRTEEASPALTLARALQARRAAQVLDLPRLPHEEVRTMARSCLSDAGIPAVIDEALNTSADGLPFLVEELLAGWIGSGSLVRLADGWHVVGHIERVVPLSFAETVRRRIDRLGDAAGRVLQAAGVLGRRFDWTLLPRITGEDEGTVLASLHRAADAQLVTAEGGAEPAAFRFRHALTRDAILDALLPPERAALARRCAEAVEVEHPGLPGELCELTAELAAEAGDHQRAAELLLEAGRRALARGALGTAEATLDRARLLGSGTPALLMDIDEALTAVLSLAGKTDRGFQVGEALLRTLRSLPTASARRAKVHLRLARAATAAGRWAEAHEQLEQARKLAAQAADATLLPGIDALAAHVALGCGRPDEAAALAQAALAAAEPAALLEIACEALEVLGRCARLRDLGQAEAAFARALAVAEEHGLTVWRIRALHELGTVDLLRGGPLVRLEEARTLALQAGALATAATLDVQIAAGRVIRFDAEGAIEAARRCATVARRFRLKALLGMALIFQAAALAQRGQRAEMEEMISEALAMAPDDPDVQAASWGQCRAHLSLIQEDRRQAFRELEIAMAFARRSPASGPGPYRGLWALVCAVDGPHGDDALAEVRASGVAVHRQNSGYLGLAQAVLLGRAGRPEEAQAAFARADAELAGLAWYRQHARRLVAEAAVEDGWGDPVAWLLEALAFFKDLGHDEIASACRVMLRKAGAPVPRKGRGESEAPPNLRSLGVTSREMDVLRLLAEGLSNRDIGARLYLSPRTVERHVASLMAKTGLRTRSQLIAYAAARTADLIPPSA